MMGQKQQQRLIGTLLLVCFIAILAYIVLSKVSQNEVLRQTTTAENESEFSSLVEPIEERIDDESVDLDAFSTNEEAFIDLPSDKPANSAPQPQIVDKQDDRPASVPQEPVTKAEAPPAMEAKPAEEVVTTPPVAENKTTPAAPAERPAPEAKPEPAKPVIASDPVLAPTAETAPQWILQLGSFSVEANATNLKKQLEDIGYKPMIEQTRSAGTVIYRVRLQPNSDRNALEKTAATIRQQLNLNTQIFPYQ